MQYKGRMDFISEVIGDQNVDMTTHGWVKDF